MEQTKQQQLSRSQQRESDRRNKEATELYNQLGKRFFDFFILQDNPEGQEVVDMMELLSKKWRFYCKSKSLLPVAYSVLDTYMKGVIKSYIELPKDGIPS